VRIGLRVAEWLAGNGAEHLVLTSRRAAWTRRTPRDCGSAWASRSPSPPVTPATGRLAALLAGHPPTAVVHAAGVGQHRLLPEMDLAEVAEVLSGKIAAR